MNLEKIAYHAYDNISELTTEELVALISEILDIEEVSFALDELYKRNPEKAMGLGKEILEQYRGDKYLQASVVDFFADIDMNYLIDYINRHLDKMTSYVYRSALYALTDESEQPIAQQLPDSFLRRIIDKYQSYDDEEKGEAEEQYKAFMEAYGQRLQFLKD